MLRRLAAACVAAAVLVTGAYAFGAWEAGGDLEERRARVAERGVEVMPFELERTTHVFAPRADGGVQTVTADEPGDALQAARIRAHLREEAAAFRRGEFDDPAAIHGAAMPGLAALQAGYARIEIAYEDVPAGGRLRYTTPAPPLVEALHAWFEAQLGDHGEHATRG